jgi:iron complex outermembrane recepter protein
MFGALLLGGLLGLGPGSRTAQAASVQQLKKLTLEELMDVEVTSVSRTPEKLRDASAAIQVITGAEIERSGAFTLPETLRLASNLQVAQKNPHDWGISARGFNAALANKLLVMIDGRSVYTPLFSGVFWDVQDTFLADIDRIEVVSGPGGTLWGANAVNGVINVITKSAKDTPGLMIATGGGTELRDFASVRAGAQVGPEAYLRVYGKFFDRDAAVMANGVAAPDSWSMRRGGFRFDAGLWSSSNLTLQGDVYSGSEYIVTGGIQQISGGNVLGRWAHRLGRDSEVSLKVYFDRTHLVDPVTNQFGPTQPLTDDLDTGDVDFQHQFHLGEQHGIVWGLGYRLTRDRVQNANNTAFLPADLDRHLMSFFLQDEIQLTRTLALTLGSKMEHNDYTGFEYEPSGRLRWQATSEQMWWGAVSRAVRMPARYDRDIFQPKPPPVVVSGNKNFVSETLLAYELGYRAQLGPRWSTSVSGYYNQYDHLRSFGPASGTTRPVFLANNLDADTYGAEWSATYEVTSDWRLRAGYNYLQEHVRIKPGEQDLFGGQNEVSDPKHQASLRSSLDLGRAVTLDLAGRWVDQLQTTSGVVPSYGELDGRVGWRLSDQCEFSVVGQNLLHAHHPEFGIAIPRREEMERSVYAKIVLRY